MKIAKMAMILLAEIIIASIIFMGLSYWQESDMLQSDVAAPALSAQSLDGKTYHFPLRSNSSERTLVYFFAPWCKICHLSIGNLNILREQIDQSKLAIIIVALDWKTKEEVTDFINEHELDFPVLLGNQRWQQEYKIKGFPSYYVLDKKGDVLSRSMGYSSALGMLRRSIYM